MKLSEIRFHSKTKKGEKKIPVTQRSLTVAVITMRFLENAWF